MRMIKSPRCRIMILVLRTPADSQSTWIILSPLYCSFLATSFLDIEKWCLVILGRKEMLEMPV